MDRDEVWRTIDSERAALADLLETLSEQEWEHPSLCPGWRVRDVAAHVISSPQADLARLCAAMIRARGSFNRSIRDDGIRMAARPTRDIVADYRRLAGSRRHPPGTSHLDPLLDVLVHTQDIAIPLGRTHPMPVDAARAAAVRAWRIRFLFSARARLRGLQINATDIEWTVGDGALVEGPIEALLLLVTGRVVSLPRLTGDGLEVLKSRLPPSVVPDRRVTPP